MPKAYLNKYTLRLISEISKAYLKEKCISGMKKAIAVQTVANLNIVYPIGLIKTESDFIVRSIKTGLRR